MSAFSHKLYLSTKKSAVNSQEPDKNKFADDNSAAFPTLYMFLRKPLDKFNPMSSTLIYVTRPLRAYRLLSISSKYLDTSTDHRKFNFPPKSVSGSGRERRAILANDVEDGEQVQRQVVEFCSGLGHAGALKL